MLLILADDADPAAVARKVATAAEEGDSAALAALAARENPDAWLVAEALCAERRFDAAAAFAAGVRRPGCAALARYVETRRAAPPDEEAHAALQVAEQACDEERWEDALAASRRVPAEPAGVTATRALEVGAIALHRLGRLRECLPLREQALAGARDLRWSEREARLLCDMGLLRLALREYDEGIELLQRGVAAAEATGHRGLANDLAIRLGIGLWVAGKPDGALALLEPALQRAELAGDRGTAVMLLLRIGDIERDRGEDRRALAAFERALPIATAEGNSSSLVGLHERIGGVHAALGHLEEAVGQFDRAVDLAAATGLREDLARCLRAKGDLCCTLGDTRRALDAYGRALREAEAASNASLLLTALVGMSRAHHRAADLPRALEYIDRAILLAEQQADPVLLAGCLLSRCVIHLSLNDPATAMGESRRALAIAEKVGERQLVAEALVLAAEVAARLGDPDGARRLHERRLKLVLDAKDRSQVADALLAVARLQASEGETQGATAAAEKAVALAEATGRPREIRAALSVLADVRNRAGDAAGASSLRARIHALAEGSGDPSATVQASLDLARLQLRARLGDDALPHLRRALALARDLGPRPTSRVLCCLATGHRLRKEHDEAARLLSEAIGLAESLASPTDVVFLREEAALLAMACADWEGAVHECRLAVEAISGIVKQVGPLERAGGLESWGTVFETGCEVGRVLKDPAVVWFFAEFGRATGLLEALGGREALAGVNLSPDLATAEKRARSAEAAARVLLDKALEAGAREEIRERRAALDEARTLVAATTDRIHREARAVAQLTYPRPAPIAEVQARLRPGDAFVLYAGTRYSAQAVVVTSGEARLVPLGPPGEIEAACDAPEREGLPRLRPLVVDPLALDASVARVFLSPDARLSGVPFCLLFGDRDVILVPSGTVHTLLDGAAAPRGEGVLAFGDPETRAAAGLARLPASAEEARLVGDVVFLGGEATETRLRSALTQRPRWRSLHLACHALVDPQRPRRTALALAPDAEEDGWLTLDEVLRLKVPCDLAVLSACETAKGKSYRVEGAFGLPRALLFAGAPRVIVSLWKVDDAATCALMTRFYENWRTLPASSALRKAQRQIAAEERWQDPKYWAAWQLWGLAD